MKKSCIYFSCLLFTLIIGCNEEVNVRQQPDQESLTETKVKNDKNNSRISNGEISFYRPERGTVYIHYDTTNHEWVVECTGSDYSCRLFRRPTTVPLDLCKMGFCEWDPYVDPWELAKIIDPLKLPSLAGYLDEDVSELFSMIPLNEEVLLLQFYKPNGKFLTKDRLHLTSSMPLDKKNVAGLNGTVVPANNYPVLYNEKDNTYNALVSVADYPIAYDREILKLSPDNFKGSLNDLFSSYDIKPLKDAKLIETSQDYFDVSPYLSKGINGIYAFSAGLGDVNFVFYGDPSPQPSKLDPTPTPMKVWLDKEMWLPQQIADALNIQPFLIKPDDVFQSFDEEKGLLRVKIINRNQ